MHPTQPHPLLTPRTRRCERAQAVHTARRPAPRHVPTHIHTRRQFTPPDDLLLATYESALAQAAAQNPNMSEAELRQQRMKEAREPRCHTRDADLPSAFSHLLPPCVSRLLPPCLTLSRRRSPSPSGRPARRWRRTRRRRRRRSERRSLRRPCSMKSMRERAGLKRTFPPSPTLSHPLTFSHPSLSAAAAACEGMRTSSSSMRSRRREAPQGATHTFRCTDCIVC